MKMRPGGSFRLENSGWRRSLLESRFAVLTVKLIDTVYVSPTSVECNTNKC